VDDVGARLLRGGVWSCGGTTTLGGSSGGERRQCLACLEELVEELVSRELASLSVLQNVSLCWVGGGPGNKVPGDNAVIAIVTEPRWGRWQTGVLCLRWFAVWGVSGYVGRRIHRIGEDSPNAVSVVQLVSELPQYSRNFKNISW
jgi:hypothetical protein